MFAQEYLTKTDMGTYRFIDECIGDLALVENGRPVRSKTQSRRLEGCAVIVRWRDRQNHAFAL
jgi:hypothetical protein